MICQEVSNVIPAIAANKPVVADNKMQPGKITRSVVAEPAIAIKQTAGFDLLSEYIEKQGFFRI